MKTSIERESLLKSLSHIQSVVERRNTIPILSNVLIEASERALKLAATDLDLEIVETLPADVIGPGGTTAPAHMLYEIVRKLPEGAQVHLEAGGSDGRLSVRAGRSRFSLATLPREDFPVLAAGELPHQFSMDAALLASVIGKTRFAISTEETRYYLNGIYLHVLGGAGKPAMRAVATDGHRLARLEFPVPKGAQGMPGIIVPRKAVGELSKLIVEETEPIHIALSENKIRFALDDLVLTTKLIDGTFPDYSRVIPTGNDKAMQVNVKEFTEAVDRVSTVSTEKSRAVKLAIQSGQLTLTVVNPESGTATEELSVEYGASALEIGFNGRYLLDIMAQMTGREAQFAFADQGSPVIVRDPEDASALYVLMPMRV